MQPLVIEARRGDGIESTHAISAVVVAADGTPVAWSGQRNRPTFLRSAAKPFQALPLVADGAADRFAVRDEELALACASHNSEARHVDLVRAWVERIGCSEKDLVCGPHRPLSADLAVREAGEARPAEEVPSGPLASNCSGKHTGMLALAIHHGWPTDGYERAGHPVQRRCKEELSEWTDVPVGRIGEAVDGCGVVCFRLPLDAIALGFARLGTSDDLAARAVRRAMTSHPDLIAGRNRLCTELMQAYPGRVLAKVGADGVYGASLPDRGLGVALKVEDGSSRAATAALIAVLDRLGLDPPPSGRLARFAEFAVVNTRGERVGTVSAAGELTFG